MEEGPSLERAVKFIVNPVSGDGRTGRLIPRLIGIAQKLGIKFDLQITKAPEHATELAEDHSGQFDVIVAVGGDGTVNEVAAGTWKSERVMGIIPTGTGNDFVKAIGRLRNMHDYLKRIISGRIKSVDVGTVRLDKKDLVFVNGVGIGFDAEVAKETVDIHRLKGLSRYLVALVRVLSKYRAAPMTIEVDGDIISQKTFLVAVGNGISAGGGFLLTPNAVLDDGKLDACIVGEVSVPRVIRMVPKVLSGKHVSEPEVTMRRASKLNIRTERPVAIHRDGEVRSSRLTEIDIGLSPRSLRILV